jgi:WD40 repeat protein
MCKSPAPLAHITTDGDVRKLCFSDDGRHLLAALRNGCVLVVDCEHWTVQRSVKIHDGGIFGMAVHQDLCVTGGADGILQITNFAHGTLQQRWKAHANRITSVVMNASGDRIFSASHDGEVRSWDLKGRLIHSMIAHVGPVTCIRLSSDEATLFSGGHDHRILVWDAVTGDLQREIVAHSDHLTDLTLAPGGTDLLSSGLDGAIRLWGVHETHSGDNVP